MKLSFFLLLGLQSKRLLRRFGFWLILALIPLLTLALANAAKEEAGIVSVALAMEDPSDPVASAAVEHLMADSSVVRYKLCDPETARRQVREGTADVAWVFAEDAAEAMRRYVQGEREPFVEVYQRGEETLLTLAKEQLLRSAYNGLSYELYRCFLEENFGTVDEDKARHHYDNALPMESILVVESLSGEPVAQEENYLTVVLRGLLSLVVVLAGMAGALFAMEDHERGVFWALSPLGRGLASLSAVLVSAFWSAAAMGLALALGGLFSSALWQELLCLVLLVPASAGFCLVCSAAFARPYKAGVFLPFLMAAVLGLSPIFFNMAFLGPLQGFLPTYHYLYGAAESGRLWAFGGYALLAPAAGLGLYCLKKPR